MHLRWHYRNSQRVLQGLASWSKLGHHVLSMLGEHGGRVSPIEVEEIKALIELFERSTLTELVLERGEMRLFLKRQGPGGQVQASVTGGNSSIAATAGTKPAEVSPPSPTQEETAPPGYIIKSPLVGRFYGRPSPTEEPYVEVGDRVDVGDTVCLIEAMKVMNEVRAERAGLVKEILVEDGQPVEYGQPLLILEPLVT